MVPDNSKTWPIITNYNESNEVCRPIYYCLLQSHFLNLMPFDSIEVLRVKESYFTFSTPPSLLCLIECLNPNEAYSISSILVLSFFNDSKWVRLDYKFLSGTTNPNIWTNLRADCHNRIFNGSGLAIVRHSLFNDKWAKSIRSCVAYGQTTYARASDLSFKRRFYKVRAERDFLKRRYISKQERNNNGLQYITLGREKLTTSRMYPL